MLLFRPRARGGRRALTVGAPLAIVAALNVAGPPAFAQSTLDGVQRELERAEADLAGLRRIQPIQEGEPSRLARVEVRLGILEEQLRQLTGRVEELEFGQRSIGQRIDRLVSDLDDRLMALEGGRQPQAAAQAQPAPPEVATRPAGAEQPPAEQPPQTVARAAPAPAPGRPGAAEDEGTIGTIPESALLNLPRPDPGAATAPPRSALSPQEQYDAAMELLRAGDYGGAEQGLQLFLDLNPEHPLAANAAYWLAETHYVRRNYAAAAAAFARNYRTYGRNAAKGADNLLKLGMSLQGLGEAEKACLSYAELMQEYPSAPAHIQQAVARERDRAQCA